MPSVPSPGSELEVFAAAHNWKGYWSNIVSRYVHGSVLEVGAGIGSNVSFLVRHAKSWTCLEPDAGLFRQLEKLCSKSAASYEFLHGKLQDIEPSRTFDTILYIDVLEHIEKDLDELRDAALRLRPQGTLVVLVPAHQFLFTPFDRTIGHFRRYNAAGLRSRTPHSLILERLIYLDSFGLFASLGNKLLLRQSMPSKGQILIWDKVLVPLSRHLDPLLGNRFGKSLLAVWRKSS